MARPTQRHMTMLKRVSRYLRYAPRVHQRLFYHDGLNHVDVFSDSDHAGCIRSRTSTSGFVLTLAGNFV
eukprot:893161-Amphidinium_carterae.1